MNTNQEAWKKQSIRNIHIQKWLDMCKNNDGTVTLKVQAVFPYKGLSKLYTHEVTVRDMEDGSIQYVANRVTELPNEAEASWHVPRLTRTEWENCMEVMSNEKNIKFL